jgi:uncharacterized membrane protein (DUF2068 family)
MATSPEEKDAETCRFCNFHDTTLPGTKICDCDLNNGYAHFKCFYSFVKTAGHQRCEFCKKQWFVDKAQWKGLVVRHRGVTVVNRIREAASILLSIILILAMTLLWATLVKFGYWVVYSTPSYLPFNVPSLASTGWFHFSVGDLVVGGIATALNITLAVGWVHYKSQCFRCCCLSSSHRRQRSEYSEVSTPNQMELIEIKSLASLSDGVALDQLTSRQLSVRRGASVQLSSGTDSSDNDSDD